MFVENIAEGAVPAGERTLGQQRWY